MPSVLTRGRGLELWSVMQAVVRAGLWGGAGEGGLYLASRLTQQWVPFLDYWEVINMKGGEYLGETGH